MLNQDIILKAVDAGSIVHWRNLEHVVITCGKAGYIVTDITNLSKPLIWLDRQSVTIDPVNFFIGDIDVIAAQYLDYINNFLTIHAFADHYHVTEEISNLIVSLGRAAHEERL